MNQRNTRSGNSQARGKMLRNWLILIAIVVVAAAGYLAISGARAPKGPKSVSLSCFAGQSVKPFGEYVLFYDGVSIHCLTSTNTVRWSLAIGEGAKYNVGEKAMVAWLNTQMYILDYEGRPTYQDTLGDVVQFAAIGKKYAAAVIGPDTNPTLVVRDLQGTQVDQETEAFKDQLLLDVGFYGDQGQYLWATLLDVYGTAPNMTMKTFEVGKKNTGESMLGESVPYRILFENNRLRVITTREMRAYNYQGIESATDAMLVYGWRLVNAYTPSKGDAMMLFAPTEQTGSQFSISELRLLSGNRDRRYTVPTACVGAVVNSHGIYAFSSQYIYYAKTNSQRFEPYEFPIKNKQVTEVIGLLEGGKVLLACGDEVFVVTLPNG
jgi:Predicted hydrolase of alkaline phosphatase superfamily